MSKYVLGLNAVYHEPAACLLKDGNIVAAVEEERFNRVKHSRLKDPLDRIPIKSISFCLNKANISFDKIDYIGYSFNPKANPLIVCSDNYFKVKLFDYNSIKKIIQTPLKLSELFNCNISKKFFWIEHHLCHAASSYFVSPFNESAILSLDGIGENVTTWLGYGNKNKIETIKEIIFPNSIGFLWEAVSKFFGYGRYDACKIMGMAAYGDKKKFENNFKDVVKLTNYDFEISKKTFGYELPNRIPFKHLKFKELEKKLSVKRNLEGELRDIDFDIASNLQDVTEKIVLKLCDLAQNRTNSKNLCIAGGVALNCVMNKTIEKKTDFENIFIQPAAYDAGTSIGAAYYIWNNIFHNEKKYILEHVFLGPKFSNDEVKKVLDKKDVKYKKCTNIQKATAELIEKEFFIGWFQGELEFGPRALGHRSIIADPRNKNISKILNSKIKKREWFRPYAPAVLIDKADEYFIIDKKMLPHQFMLIAVETKKPKIIPAVVHVDNTSRVQLVDKKVNPMFYNLILEFEKITGIPVVMNTSFNRRGEPIVCTPENAVDMLKNTALDYLAINDFLVEKI